MKQLIIILFCLAAYVAPAQELLLSGTDTLICFTPDQSKFLLKQVTELEYCQQQDSINSQIIAKQDSTIKAVNKVVENNNNQLNVANEIIDLRTEQLNLTKADLAQTEKKLKRQKVKSRIGFSVGGTIIAVLTTLLLIK